MADIAGCNLPVLNPPSNAKLQKLQSFYDIDKGHLVKITIVDKPADLTDLCNWIAYRKSIGKPIHAGLRHNNHLACKLIEIKMHNEHSPVFIHPETMDVYIDADKHRKMSKHDAVAFRYILHYCGYRLKKKRVKGVWIGKRVRTKQTDLGAL